MLQGWHLRDVECENPQSQEQTTNKPLVTSSACNNQDYKVLIQHSHMVSAIP